MNKGIATSAVILAALLAALALFDADKRHEAIDTDDVVMAIRVPILKAPSVRPIVPAGIAILHKSSAIVYDADAAADMTTAIVIMVVPKEYEAEVIKLAGQEANVELLSDEEVIASKSSFGNSDRVLQDAKDAVAFALTPGVYAQPK